jgi:palmitoyl transferase
MALASLAHAGVTGELGGLFQTKLERIRLTLREGQTELYATGYAWHLPWAYSEPTRARLNETTWGGGIGRTMIDGQGDRHSVFALALSDSHRSAQWVAGYGWQRSTRADRAWGAGWGYMAFLFSREDVAGRCPLPALLPCASLRWRRWEALGMFVPRVSKAIRGDVVFAFLRTRL